VGDVVTTEGELLKQRAQAGDPEAQMQLAVIFDGRGQHGEAVQWLRMAADAGHPPAQYVLGARYVVGRAAEFNPEEGARFISMAAAAGMPEALNLMAVLATYSAQWTEAMTFLKDAAAGGDVRAQQQVDLLGSRQHFDAGRWDSPVTPNWKSESPRIGIVEGFIPVSFCRWIIKRAQPKLESVRVRDPARGGGQHANYRTNTGAGFSLIESDVILQMVNARVADTIGLSIANQEPTNVLHYKPGEEYKPHHDFITATPAVAQELATTGQRAVTALIYLNDDYEGGETEFPMLKWKFKGKAGDALFFWNVDGQGKPIEKTLHAGLPPRKGEKWLYSKWVRENPYPLI